MATAQLRTRCPKHMSPINKHLIASNVLRHFVRSISLLCPALILVSYFCRPAIGAVAVSPEVVALSGDQIVGVSAKINTSLPVIVDLVELSQSFSTNRKRNRSFMWSGHTVAHLTRHSDGTFTTTINLNQRQPATRYFQVKARYAFLPVPRMNGTDLRVATTQRALQLPPDPGPSGNASLEGIDIDHDGLRDDVQREIFFLAPQSARLRAALKQEALFEQTASASVGLSKEDMKRLVDIDGSRSYNCLHYIVRDVHKTAALVSLLNSIVKNNASRQHTYDRNELVGQSYYSVGTSNIEGESAMCDFNPDFLTD